MNAHELNLRRNRYQGMESIAVFGPFDKSDGGLETLIRQILEEGQTNMVFDLSQTTYVTSSAIGAIIKTIKRFHAVNGTIYVYGVTPDIKEFLMLSRIDAYVRFL